MNSAGYVTIRPKFGRISDWILARIGGSDQLPGFKQKSKAIRPAIRPISCRIYSRIPLCPFPPKFFILPFKIRTCPQPNRLPTNHINLEIEPLQPKISHEHCQTCLYTYSYKFTTQKTMLNQNTFKIFHPSRSYTKEY